MGINTSLRIGDLLSLSVGDVVDANGEIAIFGYHAYKKSGANIGLVQKLFNHSASKITLRYIGIDREQMDNIFLELNL